MNSDGLFFHRSFCHKCKVVSIRPSPGESATLNYLWYFTRLVLLLVLSLLTLNYGGTDSRTD